MPKLIRCCNVIEYSILRNPAICTQSCDIINNNIIINILIILTSSSVNVLLFFRSLYFTGLLRTVTKWSGIHYYLVRCNFKKDRNLTSWNFAGIILILFRFAGPLNNLSRLLEIDFMF